VRSNHIEERQLGSRRDGFEPEQHDQLRSKIIERILKETSEGKKEIVFSADTAGIPNLFSATFARHLLSIRSIFFPHGLLLTFHREKPDAGTIATLEDNVKDLAGVRFESPQEIFKNVEHPLIYRMIDNIRIRVLPHALGEPLPAHDKKYEDKVATNTLGFGSAEVGVIQTNTMVVATKEADGEYSDVTLIPLSELAVHPNMQALHYGGALFEGMSAEWGEDGNCYIYNIEAHWQRYARGCIRLGYEPIPLIKFEEAIIKVVQQNVKFIPKDGRLYLRPHGADAGPQMRVGNSLMQAFYVEVTPIGSVESYFGAIEKDSQGNIKGKGLIVPARKIRSARGLGGLTKVVGNYAMTAVLIREAKKLNAGSEKDPLSPVGILFIDKAINPNNPEELFSARIRETNASNIIFIKKDADENYTLITPSLDDGDILPGNTRALIIEKARSRGWKVEERDVTIGEISERKFCAVGNCGTAAVLSPVDWIQLGSFEPENKDVADSPIKGRLIPGTKFDIRTQKEINAEPMPKPLQILMEDVLAVKRAANPADTEKYLTMVPGIKLKRHF